MARVSGGIAVGTMRQLTAILIVLGALASQGSAADSTPPLPGAWWTGWFQTARHGQPLPLTFRNHCHVDRWGRTYCSAHCGADYEFLYCSKKSFGCCLVGRGYCGYDSVLRCAP